MKIDWVRVGEVLALQRREVAVEPDVEYEEIGVRSFGRGIFHKEPSSGIELGNKRVFRIEPGDLVLSNVFAWEGAIAVASEPEKGRIGSHRFMTFTPVGDSIDASWARWWFLSERGLELIGQASPGSAGRNRTLAIERFEALEIPLPPIEDQRRVSTRLDHVATTTWTLSAYTSHASTLASALAVSATARPDLDESAKRLAGWEQIPLRAVLTPSKEQVVVEATGSYPNVGIYSFGRGLFKKPDIDGSATSAKTLNRISSGQFIYSRLFAFEGAYAHVPESFDGHFVSNEFPTFDVDRDRLDAGWLATYLRSPARWDELRGSSKGLGVRRQRVPVEAILDYSIWLPPRSVQHQTIALLAQLEESQLLRQQGDNRIDALLPAAMNEAFAGLS